MVKAAMREDTILVTIMWANNEIGTINDIPAIGALCKSAAIIFHTDATQWVGKMPTDVEPTGRSALDVRAQDLRAQGRRRPVSSAAASPASA
jgi:cysteine desulfurase